MIQDTEPRAFILRVHDQGYPEAGRDYYVFTDPKDLWRYVDDHGIKKYDAILAIAPQAQEQEVSATP